MWKWFAVGLCFATSVAAQEWQGRAGDQGFAPEALQDHLSGQVLEFFDGGQSRYDADGRYLWSYAGGGDWYGTWEVSQDSVVCVTFVTEVTRCDRIVQNDGRTVVLTADGQRFPVRRILGQ